MATNELGVVTLSSPTTLPIESFVDNGHGGWSLDGSAFAVKGGAMQSHTKSTWSADLTGNMDDKTGSEVASTWVMSIRAKIGNSADQVLWFLRYGSEGVGSFLRTVANGHGGIDLSLEWSGNASFPPFVNVILEDVDTTDYHHYVITSAAGASLKLYVDGVQRWTGSRVTAYADAEGSTQQNRNLGAKSYNSLWLGRVDKKENVGTGAWTTLYDDVRFYSTNETTGEDVAIPTAAQIAELTDILSAERVLPSPTARFAVSFDGCTLSDSAGVIVQEGEDSGVPQRAFCSRIGGGHSLCCERLPSGVNGVCLYQNANAWAEYQPLLGGNREDATAFAVSLVARIAPVNNAAVCYLQYGNPGSGDVLYTVTNETGGTDLALAWLKSSKGYAYPNVLARNIDTQNYHHYVLVCSVNSSNTRPVRLYIDSRPVTLFTDARLTYYNEDNSKQSTATRAAASKCFSGFYLAAARGSEHDCIAPTSTRYGDVRIFSGEVARDEFGLCAIDGLGVEALFRSLMPYEDVPPSGMRIIFK